MESTRYISSSRLSHYSKAAWTDADDDADDDDDDANMADAE